MIKFTGDKAGRKLIGFSLTAGNIKRLQEGKPIHVKMEDMHLPPADLLIFYGETPEKLFAEMEKSGLEFTDETKYNLDKEFFKE